MTSGCQARRPSPGLNCVLMSRLVPRSDHLSQGVLLPVWEGALRGGKCQFYTSDKATKAVTPITSTPPVVEILFNTMSSEMAHFALRFQPPHGNGHRSPADTPIALCSPTEPPRKLVLVGLHLKWRDVVPFGYILDGAIRPFDFPGAPAYPILPCSSVSTLPRSPFPLPARAPAARVRVVGTVGERIPAASFPHH